MRGYVSMVGDLFHVGHINLVRAVRELGYDVLVGVHSDEEVEDYKRTPVMTMDERVAAVGACKYVAEVIPAAPTIIDEDFINKHNIDMVFHGHTQEEDHLYHDMFQVPMRLGKFTRTERTPGISTTMLIERVEKSKGSATKFRVSSLYDLLQALKSSRSLRVLETHNGLSGIIADTVNVGGNEFDALWSSSLTASVSKGKPDIEVVDTSMRLQLVRDTMEVTCKPMIYDADTGGQPEILRFTVRALEDIGVSACIIEDKCGLKQNSLFGTSRQQNLEDIPSFCAKLKAATEARRDKKFMVIARIEALISGAGEAEAICRAKAYIEAGADAIMIHSSQKTFDEIRSFMDTYNKLDKRVPVVAVPSTYNYVTEDDLFRSGISICIYANHMLRAAYPRMQQVAEGILRAGTGAYIQNMMASVKNIINLLPNTGQAQDVPLRRVPVTKVPSTLPNKVNANDLARELCDRGIKRFFGVPDSVLKTFCNAVDDLTKKSDMTHVISCNEGTALTTAIGWHMATNDVPVVYLQNSGFGNMINPLMSLCHGDAFGIPAVLLIGWRGEPGVKDEPQHRAQGRQMIPMLDSCEIESLEMPCDTIGAAETLKKAIEIARSKKCPVAVLVRRGILDTASKVTVLDADEAPRHVGLTRREALENILDLVGDSDDFIISTTGYTSRELYAIREKRCKDSKRPVGGELFMVGSMGHALSIAQGVALAQPQRRIWCIDGDGGLLMHMGGLVSTAGLGVKNLVHVVLNNSCHESVGGQRTAASQAPDVPDGPFFPALARAVGYSCVFSAMSGDELRNDLNEIAEKNQGHVFLEVTTRIDSDLNKKLPRPKETLAQFRDEVYRFLHNKSTMAQ